jgi:hypothetical protein
MSTSYTKLFSSIITSTIWSAPHSTRIVWITLLAMSDKNGEVFSTIPGLARMASVTIDEAKAAISAFLAPDPYSRTDDEDGKRIEIIEGGWSLINHAKYRAMASREESKASNAERQRKFRDRQKRNETKPESEPLRNGFVTASNGLVTAPLHIAEADTDTDTENKKKNTKKETTAKSLELRTIESWFGRRAATTPTKAESVAWRSARKAVEETSEDEWKALERFYRAPQSETYARKSIAVLLNNWQSEIDRAKAWKPKHGGEFSASW